MSYKLNKAEIKERDELVFELRKASNKINVAIAAYNEAVAAQRDILTLAVDRYNGLVDDVSAFVGEVTERIDEYIDDKSEKWRDSDKGEVLNEFKNTWGNWSCEEYELEVPDDIAFEEPDHADELENLPFDSES